MAKKKRTIKRTTNGQAKRGPKPVAFPLEREFPVGQVGIGANDLIIQHDDSGEVQLLFFQTHPPLLLGETEAERNACVDNIKSVRSVCVSRLVVSEKRFALFAKAMQEQATKLEEHPEQ